jgi:hypothetical protein
MRPLVSIAHRVLLCMAMSAPLALANGLPAGTAVAATVAGTVAHPIPPAAVEWVAHASGGFWLGNPQGKPTLTVFLDPNCSVCHRFYEELQPLIRAKGGGTGLAGWGHPADEHRESRAPRNALRSARWTILSDAARRE